jgi:hypothetical protein
MEKLKLYLKDISVLEVVIFNLNQLKEELFTKADEKM